jgi:hypothetical protein
MDEAEFTGACEDLALIEKVCGKIAAGTITGGGDV